MARRSQNSAPTNKTTKKPEAKTPRDGNGAIDPQLLNDRRLQIILALIGSVAVIAAALIGIVPWLVERLNAIQSITEPTSNSAEILTVASLTPTPLASATLMPSPIPTLTSLLQPTPLDYVRDNRDWQHITQAVDGVTMVMVPIGCINVGTLCFDSPFWIDQTEVTQHDYQQMGGEQIASISYASIGDRKPVTNISPEDASSFCHLRSATLPTEGEWQYAASGPSEWDFPWGNTFERTIVTYRSNLNVLSDVGIHRLGASWVGALDMSGNAAEWTTSTNSAGGYVVRGGSWNDTQDAVSTKYSIVNKNAANLETGFRCVIH